MQELTIQQLSWLLSAIDGKACNTTGEAMMKAGMLGYFATQMEEIAKENAEVEPEGKPLKQVK